MQQEGIDLRRTSGTCVPFACLHLWQGSRLDHAWTVVVSAMTPEAGLSGSRNKKSA